MDSVKNTLLDLTSEQKEEMRRIKEDYFFIRVQLVKKIRLNLMRAY
ncbi:hypothetical protein ACK2FW_09290 [Clostridioides difficile]